MPTYAQVVAETPCFNCGERQLQLFTTWPTHVVGPTEEYQSGYIRCRNCGEKNDDLWYASRRVRPLWRRVLVTLAHIPVGLAIILAAIGANAIIPILIVYSVTVGPIVLLLRRAKIIHP